MGSLRKAAFSVATENQQRASANLQLWPKAYSGRKRIRQKEVARFYPWNPRLYRNRLTRTGSCRCILKQNNVQKKASDYLQIYSVNRRAIFHDNWHMVARVAAQRSLTARLNFALGITVAIRIAGVIPHDLLKALTAPIQGTLPSLHCLSLQIDPELGAVLWICKGPFAFEVIHPEGPAPVRFKSDVRILG